MADGNPKFVPVIKNTTSKFSWFCKSVSGNAQRARGNNLRPEEIQGGTFTFTNIGNFGSLTGMPSSINLK